MDSKLTKKFWLITRENKFLIVKCVFTHGVNKITAKNIVLFFFNLLTGPEGGRNVAMYRKFYLLPL
jgi:hypothetical protein